MSFNWSEYLDLADELGGKQAQFVAGREARLRSAISRAYYAAFITARNYLRDQEDQKLPFTGNVHEYVIMQFLTSENPRYNKIGQLLAGLRRTRNQADYQDTVRKLPYNSLRCLNNARLVITLVKKL